MRLAYLALLPAALGVTLLFLSIPRAVGAWLAFSARAPLDELQSGQPPSEAELQQGIAGLQEAIEWRPSGRRLTDLGLLELEQAVREPNANTRRAQLLASSEKHLLAGLAANPVNGFVWMRLALVREMTGAPPRQIAAALMQSLDVSPNMRKLWFSRMAMLLAYWSYLSADEIPVMRAQLVTIWLTDPEMRRSLYAAAREINRLPIVLWALSADPSLVATFEALAADAPSK